MVFRVIHNFKKVQNVLFNDFYYVLLLILLWYIMLELKVA